MSAPDDRTAIPSGTVTFLFTDIEGSTQRWERYRSAMEAALRRHDVLVREAIEAHGGHVFKTIGDAFCAAFSRPKDAVAAIFDAQCALGAEDFSAVDGLRVRAAIHTGTADERDRDYFGPEVNRVARLLGIAYGAQVLISGATAELVQASLPSGASLRDLGEHRLRDLSRAEHVYQLVGSSLVAGFPPLRSLGTRRNNLPPSLTSFVGREAEISEITNAIDEHRLVTIVGSGGVGKTRTSVQVAMNLLDGFRDGVWFVELAPLANGEYIPSTIAQTLGIALASKGDSTESLARALETKQLLLVLDNCEHLVGDMAKTIGAILRASQGVKVLASSRQGLGIDGEMIYRMPSLTVPSAAQSKSLTPTDAGSFAAIVLFVERARAVDPRFALSEDNAPIVADICRRLDGIALAIELAAARISILRPRQLRDKLDERFRLLTAGRRDLLPRQQTLRALIDWSHDLLDDRERMAFRRLGVFVDGFTLEGACAVARGEDFDEFDMLDLLASLVDKSLVLAESSGDELRYRLLESTRAYAAEKLVAAGERDLLAGRFLRYMRDRFEKIYDRREVTVRDAELYDAFAIELEGVRFALDNAAALCETVTGAALLAAIDRAWTQGFQREGIARLETFVASLPPEELLLRAKLSTTLASFFVQQGMAADALEASSTACAYARSSGDAPTLAYALRWYAGANTLMERFADADSALREAAVIPSTSARLRVALNSERIQLSWLSGDLDAAACGYEQGIADQRALENTRGVYINVINLADVEYARGRTNRAIALVREILPALRKGDDRELLANAMANYSVYLVASDDLDAAIEATHEAISSLAEDPKHFLVVVSLEHLALIDSLQGRYSRAARLAAYSDSALAAIGYRRQIVERITWARLTTLLNAALTAEDRARFSADGAAFTPEAAVQLALTPWRSE